MIGRHSLLKLTPVMLKKSDVNKATYKAQNNEKQTLARESESINFSILTRLGKLLPHSIRYKQTAEAMPLTKRQSKSLTYY